MEQSRRTLGGGALLVLVWVYATGASLYFLGLLLEQPGYWTSAPAPMRVLAVLLSSGVVFLNLLWLGLSGRDLLRGEGTQYLLSSTPEGTARISLRAIHSSLLRRAREVADVRHAKISVRRPSENRILVEVAYTTPEDRNAILVSEALRRSLRARFDELVHPEGDLAGDFDVKLDGFVPASATPRTDDRKKGESREPFTGPRYPID